ncbi:MAG: CBS domain-containing protein [Anaerolineae bacterium]
MNNPKLVRDLMSVGVPTCSLDTPVQDLTRLLLEKDWEGFVALDDQGHAAGIVTQFELVGAYVQGDWANLTAEDVMQVNVPQVPPDIPLTAVAQIMRDQGVRVLFMMHRAGGIQYPAAFITYKHLLRHLAARDDEELCDLGIKAEREPPIETFLRRREEARKRASRHT